MYPSALTMKFDSKEAFMLVTVRIRTVTNSITKVQFFVLDVVYWRVKKLALCFENCKN